MNQSHTTNLRNYKLTLDGRVQVVNVYDLFPFIGSPIPGEEDAMIFAGPYEGVTREGHGKGIRVLAHQDLSREECVELLRRMLKSMEKIELPF